MGFWWEHYLHLMPVPLGLGAVSALALHSPVPVLMGFAAGHFLALASYAADIQVNATPEWREKVLRLRDIPRVAPLTTGVACVVLAGMLLYSFWGVL